MRIKTILSLYKINRIIFVNRDYRTNVINNIIFTI